MNLFRLIHHRIAIDSYTLASMLKKNYKSHHNPIRTTMHRCIFRRRKAIPHIPSVRRPETITVVLAPMCYDGDLWCIEIN